MRTLVLATVATATLVVTSAQPKCKIRGDVPASITRNVCHTFSWDFVANTDGARPTLTVFIEIAEALEFATRSEDVRKVITGIYEAWYLHHRSPKGVELVFLPKPGGVDPYLSARVYPHRSNPRVPDIQWADSKDTMEWMSSLIR